MKNLFFVSVALCIFSGTSLNLTAQTSTKFINRINSTARSAQVIDLIPTAKAFSSAVLVTNVKPILFAGAIATEMCGRLQFKFSQLLNRQAESLTNISLLGFIDEWWHTRYRYGGTTKSGIDCSAFVGLLGSRVYGFTLPRTARDQYAASERITRNEMLEGDLVFFNTRGGISHVGLYLGDGYFVHSSVSSGVTISSLDESYYASRFVGGGRLNDCLIAGK